MVFLKSLKFSSRVVFWGVAWGGFALVQTLGAEQPHGGDADTEMAADLVLFADDPAAIEEAEVLQGDLRLEEHIVYRGEWALGMRAFEGFAFRYILDQPADPSVYRTLHLAVHLGEETEPAGNEEFNADLVGGSESVFVHLVAEERLELERRQWQTVEIALEGLGLETAITEIGLFGNLTGIFFVDEMRLVNAFTSTEVGTAAFRTIPRDIMLRANFPNPFNGSTEIGFVLPRSGEVELAVYNAVGQKIATLVDRWLQAGSQFL